MLGISATPVIPAEAVIQGVELGSTTIAEWIPACAGMTSAILFRVSPVTNNSDTSYARMGPIRFKHFAQTTNSLPDAGLVLASTNAAHKSALKLAGAYSCPSLLNMSRRPRIACLMRGSFSISEKRTWSSPYSPKPIPGDTATLASLSTFFENSSEPSTR